MEYTKKEKIQIRKSRKTIVKDMRDLWNIYPYEEVKIPVDLNLHEYGHDWYLVMNKDRIILWSSTSERYTNLERHRVHHLQDLRYTKGDYEAHFQLIKKYESVRKKLEDTLKGKAKRQQDNIEILTSVEEKHNSKAKKKEKKLEATVQIDLPETQNVHTIEISEEEGQKVGRIDFGAQTIKIITKGDIVLVNKKDEQQKVKRR